MSARHQALQGRCSGVFGELLLSWSWLEILKGKWMHTTSQSCLLFEMLGVFFHWLLSTYLRWTQELLQRMEADWALLTHTLQYLEVILLWFYAPLSSRVLIFKSIFVFIFSHIKFAGLYSESLKVWSFESWVNEIFKNFFLTKQNTKQSPAPSHQLCSLLASLGSSWNGTGKSIIAV